jgi:N12 class adenine-specific DNA methylase
VRSAVKRNRDDQGQMDLFAASFPKNEPQPETPRATVLENRAVLADGHLPPPCPVVEGTTAIPSAAISAITSEPEPEVQRNQRNYRITEADELGRGSARRKCRDNLAAIGLLKRLEDEARAPTSDEQRTLVRYVGWGGLPQAFDDYNAEWAKEREQLQTLLTPEELESARASTLNAHYTSPTVIRAMVAALERFGFTHGRILEPACGIGHFLGLLPEAMNARSQLTAVEIDSLSARITKQLYPDADVRNQPFEETVLPDGFYDVAISNIPFGNYEPYDPKLKSWHFLIHDWFFARTLDKVRPGGLILFITSKGTFDKLDAGLREYVAAQADLLGAIRLPNDTFKKNANAEVTTDVVMLRKRLPGEPPSGVAWTRTEPFTDAEEQVFPLNEYFVAHPEMMLGTMRREGRIYGNTESNLFSDGRPLDEALAEAIQRLPENVFQERASTFEANIEPLSIPAPEEVKPNAYTLLGEHVAVREGDRLKILHDLPRTTRNRIHGLIVLRNSVRTCLRSQLEDRPDSELVVVRQRLNLDYHRFVERFGCVSEPANQKAFQGDPDLPLLLSLERYDPETKRATKAAIFAERTIQRQPAPVEITSPKDALLVTLNAKGRVDLEHLSALLHRAPADFLPELPVFLDPQSDRWETEDAYLSGNVRAKLVAAEAAALIDGQFTRNVEALRAVQPTDLGPSEIDARLGAAWLPPEVVKAFTRELLGVDDVTVSHTPQLGLWVVRGGWSAKLSVANTTEWGTDRRSALDLLDDALNLRTPTVHDIDADERPVLNIPATESARDKQEKIKTRFKDWVWSDDTRSQHLVRRYNDAFNNLRLGQFDGSHLTLPGASSSVTLRPHQKAAVWRILQSSHNLLAHVVGAGKTFTMVAAAMELRRLGLARKPLFVVPNHMLGQFSSELLTLYPAANLLVASKDDFEKTRRQTLMSRIATGNWDAVIVTHSGFEKIPVSQASKEEFFRAQIRELTLAVENQRQQNDSRVVKMLERAKKRLETKLKELVNAAKKDTGLTFEELGVDHLFVDEASHYKNLFYVTKMTRVAGLPQTASQKALDLFLKVSHLHRVQGGVVFATGTPIANSVAEMFTMQRYLQMTALKGMQIDHFDAWAGTFGEPVTAMELAPDGSGYRLNTRFARFINVPELMQVFRQVADIQTQDMLQLPIPALHGGKPTTVSAPCSAELKKIVQGLVTRAEALRSGSVDPRVDNMLLITSDGRKAALDLRLMDASMPDHPTSKVNLAVEQVFHLWRDTTEKRSAQLVFSDLSTPTGGKGFSVYEDMRDKLVRLGVPAEEIAFIQDFDADNAKLALFRDVRSGQVRILFGSTQKMGSGTNVQERLVALHHLDAPWRPADVEQREGRILRQGNTNPEVHVFRYVTEASFDAYMWQTLETKARFIAQVMTGASNLRRIEDVDGAALTYAEVKAIASGNPLVVEKANLDAEVGRLSRLEGQHREAQFRLRHRLRAENDDLPRLYRRLEALRQDVALREDTRGDRFVFQLDGEVLRDRGVVGELLNRRADRITGTGLEMKAGTFAGFQVVVSDHFGRGPLILLKGHAVHEARATDTALGTLRSVEHAVQSLDDSAAKVLAHIADTEQRLLDLTAQSGQPFDHADKLASLRTRQHEVADLLDLTKNQAGQMEADPTASADPVDAPVEEEAMALREETEPLADRRDGLDEIVRMMLAE